MGKYYQYEKTKSGYLTCVAPNCKTKKSTTTLKTFEFPSDLKRRNQWISAIVDATLRNEEETSLTEDLYEIENKRLELETEISSILGDHGYLCAMHFLPRDIIVHPHVCRLTPNAVPSVFKNYATELPRQFFKKMCQFAIDTPPAIPESADSDVTEQYAYADIELSNTEENLLKAEEISEFSPPDVFAAYIDKTNDSNDTSAETETCYYQSKGRKQKFKSRGKLTKKKYLLLESRCESLKKRISQLESKIDLYNIDSLERDAENNNQEALFLLDMLRSYTDFEKTRAEILTVRKEL